MKQFNNITIKVSVIIITRNRAEMLKLCLESLTLQTRMPDEVIVVDNASTDNTKKVITHYSSSESRAESRESREVNNEAMKQLNNQTTDNSSLLARTVTFGMPPKLYIRYVYEKQIGIPYARNKGIKTAKGTLILMLDDDCVADKHWVENMIKAHKKYPKAWAIQGRTISLPEGGIYSLLIESERFFWLRIYANKKIPLTGFSKLLARIKKLKILTLNTNYIKTIKSCFRIKDFFSKGFRKETVFLTCDTKNLSLKNFYIKKHKLSFDICFYRGSDTDLGKQIVQKKGLIIFSPKAQVHHWERSGLKEFLEQRWHIGRTSARIGSKWKTPSFTSNIPKPKSTLYLIIMCKVFHQLHKSPIIILLSFLDRFYRINGWFFERNILSLENDRKNFRNHSNP